MPARIPDRLHESVRLRMIAEVPLGAFLSGGVDSSAVVAAMAGVSETPVRTCAIGFKDPKFNESAFAQQVADRYHTDHHLNVVDSDDFDLIDTLAWLYDEPSPTVLPIRLRRLPAGRQLSRGLSVTAR